MAKINILIILTLTFSIVNGHPFKEKTEYNASSFGQLYFNDTLNKKEKATTDYFVFYQKYISGIRGKECPMYPGCSNYGLKTFTETNFASAFILTTDRLLRCGHDHSNYSLTLRPNGFKLLDYPPYENPPKELYYTRNSYFFAYSDTMHDDSSFIFIKNLINNGYYQVALLEILRMEYKSQTFNMEVFINKIICLKALGEYEKALFDYDTKCPLDYKQNPELLYQISVIHYKLENYEQSLFYDSLAIVSCENCFLRPKLIALQGLIYAKEYQWTASLNSFETLCNYQGYERLCQTNTTILQEAKDMRKRSPAFAGIISIVPGAGYAYSGHKQTAITALIVNGLLAYATYSNIKNENYGMGILTGIFNLSFYIGNIQGGVSSARRFNERQKQNTISKLEFNTNL